MWELDISRGVAQPWTFGTDGDLVPVWSPGGEQIVFASNRRGAFDLYVTAAPGADEILVDLVANGGWPMDWSRDGRWVLYLDGGDIWSVPMADGQQNGEPTPYISSQFQESQGVFSPDGNWVAYTSDQSGRAEVYVNAFPTSSFPIPVSGTGGSAPVWRDDDDELFYIADDGMLTAVSVVYAPSFSLGQGEALFSVPSATGRHPYEASDDGQRFLFSIPAQSGSDTITVVLNWIEALRQRVPIP